MDRQLRDYLPPVARDIRELRAITDGQQGVVSEAWDAAGEVFCDQFIEDATKNGISRWEGILKISPKATETLEERRYRIKLRLNEKLPYTLAVLRRRLDAACGIGNYSVSMKPGGYRIYVTLSLAVKSELNDVGDLLRRIIPANIVIELGLKHNSHKTLSRFTHAGLSAYKHEELRNEVMENG